MIDAESNARAVLARGIATAFEAYARAIEGEAAASEPPLPQEPKRPLSGMEKKIYGIIQDAGTISITDILVKSGLRFDRSQISDCCHRLKYKGYISSVEPGVFRSNA